ncbi:MAG: DUF3987 domain-containing protein [Bacteroidetes bacterium]|nr:DUF3987 domain-containing protein [Bacteroidota bacterium]MCB9222464.1 DUF3987 domain-containing protein [Ignavibacteria bacterium]
MASSTIFRNFAIPVENKSLILLSKRVATDEFKETVLKVRELKAQGNPEEAQKLKQSLLAFTPSATFKQKRTMDEIDFYSGYVHLDFDKLSEDDLQNAFVLIAGDPHTFWCFRSPSGDGLKVFVAVNTSQEHHDIAYEQVKNHYESLTGLKADGQCKDITRLCFFSYDPDMYRTIDNKTFHVDLPPDLLQPVPEPAPPPIPALTQKKVHLQEDVFLKQIDFTNKKASYTNGSRNSYIYLLASNCNRAAISFEVCLDLCQEHFDLPIKELEASIKSAYNHHQAEHGKFANIANKQTLQTSDEEEYDYLKTTPTIPDEIFEQLPEILKEGSEVFPDRRKRDVFFTSALSILSGCLPGVHGYYDGEKYYPHLYTFVIAPAASGKGVLKNAKRLGDAYHERVLQASRQAQTDFDEEMTTYKETLKTRKKGDEMPRKPDEPKFQLVFIPADSSSARMIEHLQNNDGQGIICETEADTMSGAKKQDWGDYSPVLRSSFQHEKVTLTRKTNNEYVEIKEPRLAVCLSGTPAQVPKLIQSAEDGLFSRFLFYAFKNDLVWHDPSPFGRKVSYSDHFNQLSIKVLQLIDFLSIEATEIELTYDQWQLFNKSFRDTLYQVGVFTGEDAASVVFRMGLITFRVAMILTALRKFENGEAATHIKCSDDDFQIALEICKTYLQHSLLMYNNLPKQEESEGFKSSDAKRRFFEKLPQNFTRNEAQTLGQTFNLGTRTIDQLLRNANGKDLRKIKAGHYEKVEKVALS